MNTSIIISKYCWIFSLISLDNTDQFPIKLLLAFLFIQFVCDLINIYINCHTSINTFNKKAYFSQNPIPMQASLDMQEILDIYREKSPLIENYSLITTETRIK